MGASRFFLLASGSVFLIYFADVVAGAFGIGAFLSDVGGMLTLFLACIGFVIATLFYERSRQTRRSESTNGETEGETRDEDS